VEDVTKRLKRHSFYLKLGEKKRVEHALSRNLAARNNAKSRNNAVGP
jgi:hypothetical protein